LEYAAIGGALEGAGLAALLFWRSFRFEVNESGVKPPHS